MWAETHLDGSVDYITDISIHSARVGGDGIISAGFMEQIISIHSARVGGDADYFRIDYGGDISIHSARVGGDGMLWAVRRVEAGFQSTPPVWAETRVYGADRKPEGNFNPLRPCGRRLFCSNLIISEIDFNPLRPCGRRRGK